MPSGGGNTNTVTEADPWTEVQPYLKDLYASGSQFFEQGPQAYYPNQTYLDPNAMQSGAISGLGDYANSLDMSQLFGAQSQGLSGTNAMMGAYGGGLGASAGVYGDIMGGAGSQYNWGQMGDTASTRAMQAQMNPQGGNPYLDAQVNKAQTSMADVFNTDVMRNIRDEGIMTGQLGGSNQSLAVTDAADTLQENMGNVATQMYGNAYQQDMSRALQAAGMGAGMEMGVGSQQLGADQFNTQARMGAAGSIGDMYGSGMGMSNDLMGRTMAMSPSLYQAGAMPSQMLGQAGAQQSGFDQMGLDDQMARYAYPQQSEQDMMNWYSNLLAGAAPYGSTTGTSSTPYNQTAGMMGGAMAGGGLAYMMGASPWTMAGAAGLGALGMYDW